MSLPPLEPEPGTTFETIPVFTLEEALDALNGLGGDVAAVQEYTAASTAIVADS